MGGGPRAGSTLEHVPAACQRSDSFVWLGLYEPTEEEFEHVRREPSTSTSWRWRTPSRPTSGPSSRSTTTSLFLVLKTARYLDAEEQVEFGEIQVFVGDELPRARPARRGERPRLASAGPSKPRQDLLRCGPGAVLHAIVDHVVDDYGPVMAGLDKDIREVELEVFTEGVDNPVERIYKLKREVLELRQAVLPLEDALDALQARKYEPIHEDIREYFRDVHDHAPEDRGAGRTRSPTCSRASCRPT